MLSARSTVHSVPSMFGFAKGRLNSPLAYLDLAARPSPEKGTVYSALCRRRRAPLTTHRRPSCCQLPRNGLLPLLLLSASSFNFSPTFLNLSTLPILPLFTTSSPSNCALQPPPITPLPRVVQYWATALSTTTHSRGFTPRTATDRLGDGASSPDRGQGLGPKPNGPDRLERAPSGNPASNGFLHWHARRCQVHLLGLCHRDGRPLAGARPASAQSGGVERGEGPDRGRASSGFAP